LTQTASPQVAHFKSSLWIFDWLLLIYNLQFRSAFSHGAFTGFRNFIISFQSPDRIHIWNSSACDWSL